jgi:short-subunit dehydrogenase
MDYVQNKVAVITGVSGGLGLAFAQALSGRGVQVFGWGRSAPEIMPENFHFLPCDLKDPESVSAVAKQTEAMAGKPIDFLINNAGFGHFALIEEMSVSQWQEQMHINLDAIFYCTRMLLPGMKAQGFGHIVNISSVAGKAGASWGTAYSATKFGVAGLSDSLFQEVRTSGVKVSVMYPGSTSTRFFDEVPGISPHANMLRAEEIAATLVHILDTHPNCVISEVVIRPLNSKPPKV